MKVLLIDDEADVRRIARLALERVGKMQVVEAENGAMALSQAVREEPDAILLDVMMPDRDGPSVLRELREDARTQHIPVIFLTAKALVAEIERLKTLGAVAVLMKPFDPMRLAAQVREVLASGIGASGLSPSVGNSSFPGSSPSARGKSTQVPE